MITGITTSIPHCSGSHTSTIKQEKRRKDWEWRLLKVILYMMIVDIKKSKKIKLGINWFIKVTKYKVTIQYKNKNLSLFTYNQQLENEA